MKHQPLSKREYNVYLLLSLGIHFYSFYQVYLSSKEYEDELEREVGLETESSLLGLRKDASDFEWSFWMEWARSRLLWLMLGHVFISQVGRVFLGKHRSWLLVAYGAASCWLVLGTKGLAAILVNTFVFYIIAQVKSPSLTWMSSACMLLMLHNEAVQNAQRGWYSTENEFYLLQFTLIVRCLFYTSFCLEYRGLQTGDSGRSFCSMLTYVFYYPLFHSGPVIPFNEFFLQMENQDCRRSFQFSGLVTDVLRLLLWWCLAELMIHVMYIHAMYSHHNVLEELPPWTLGGLALAQLLFFYVKYLVLYGFPALIVQLDGVTPLPLPRCLSSMYSFTGVWRCFDVGLHRFLVRYIYIPMGGSRAGIARMLLSTAMTFVFVCYWHGGHEYLWYWAALNWVGIMAEHGVKKLHSAPFIQERLDRCLSPRTYRQLHAALASVSTALLILTNLVFLGGEHVGKTYWDRMFVHGWPWTPLVIFISLYCFAQIGIEWSLFLFPKYKWRFPLCMQNISK